MNIEHTYDLSQFKIIVKFLGEYLGPDYEVILHDLGKLPNTIICIENNELSGRKIGGPITKSALKMLQDKIYLEKDFIVNYKGRTSTKKFRSATMFIKNDYEEVVGLLCINFSDERYEKLHSKLFDILHPADWSKGQITKIFEDTAQNKSDEVEEYYGSIDELMENIYKEAISDVTVPLDYMKQDDRLEVIKILDKKGMFKLKGAVSYVSDHLKCSQATVYRYLNMIS